MNDIQIVIFNTNAAVYLNQRFYKFIDDITDIEQILETFRDVGHYEFLTHQNDDLSEIYEESGTYPLKFQEALEYVKSTPEISETKAVS